MLKNKLQVLVTLVFLGFFVWWISFQHVVSKLGLSVQWFGGTYALVALIGAIIGFIASSKWGGFRTVLGKALIFFSLGLLAQDAGQLISTYYVVGAHLATVPYPSWDDVAYFGSILLYICAALFLARLAGVKFSLRKTSYKTIAIVVPVVLLVVSSLIQLHNHQYDTAKPLTVFLDAGYPIGQTCYISIAVVAYLLSRKMLGGIMKSAILLVILALFIQYVADFTFIYQSYHGTYVPGKYDDLAYLVAYFAMATAMIRFLAIYNKLRSPTKIAPTSPEPHPAPQEVT